MASDQESGRNAFVVEGGHAIGGTIVPSGNKNEALPVLAATLLGSGPIQITNLPGIRDIATLLEILVSIGASVHRRDDHTVEVDPGGVSCAEPDRELSAQIRGSFLLVPGLLHRFGRALVPRPGGDRIGRRRLDTHILALRQLGAQVDARGLEYELRVDGGFVGTDVFLDEASVMGTENAVMAAAVAKGRSTIANAACEPHVQGLCRMLNALGANIRGIGTNLLEIEGVPELGSGHHRLGPDHIEIGSFAAIAAMTGGELVIEGVVPDDLRMIRLVFERLGVDLCFERDLLRIAREQKLVIEDDLHGMVPTISDAPWPGFPADLTPIALALATQAQGTMLIHEKMFESRLFFVDRLIAMGARIVLCDPHRAIVSGPSALYGQDLASPDIRAGMALLAAALTAEGTSTIMNAHQVDRGYEAIDVRLQSLGARIERA